MKTPRTIYQVDSFTGKPFGGNPAGVCILDRKPSAAWMQNVAMEMNLSETAFVFPGKSGHTIRFYTPESEIALCGHATLATGHIMFETGLATKGETIVFFSKAGKLSVSRSDSQIKMDFPSYPPVAINIPEGIEKVIGTRPVELYRSGHGWALALLGSEPEVRDLRPEFSAMKDSGFGDLIVTAISDDKRFDFCVRCFVPALGINEDPVTGSAHCALAPFWHGKTGKTQFVSHQVSKRGGILKVALKNNRVEISGKAKTICKAELFV
jgi:PhzF family phenazine biosynthesis protein